MLLVRVSGEGSLASKPSVGFFEYVLVNRYGRWNFFVGARWVFSLDALTPQKSVGHMDR